MRWAGIYLFLLLYVCGCSGTIPSSGLTLEEVYEKVQVHWQKEGYSLTVRQGEPPLLLKEPHRYYDVQNGDQLAVYVFPDSKEAAAAKQRLEKEASLEWDFLVPLYHVKDRVLFVYFTNPAKLKPAFFKKLEQVIERLEFKLPA